MHTFHTRISGIKAWALRHKISAALLALIVLFGGYRVYAAVNPAPVTTTYTLATVATSTVVSTLSESGQVAASQQLSLSPKASGQVIAVYVTPGEHVAAGEAIAQLDATDALRSLENAKLSLANQEISYQQTTATSTLALNLLTAQNTVTNAETALQKTHDASYASIASVYSDLSNTLSDLDSVLHGSNVSGHATQQNIDALADSLTSRDDSINVYKTSAQNAYDAAVTAYNAAQIDYKATALSASNDDLVTLASNTYTAASAVAQAVKNSRDFLDRVANDYTLYNLNAPAALSSLRTTVSTNTTTVTNDLSTVLTTKSNIAAEQTLAQAQHSLEAVNGGSTTLTVQQAQLSLQQAQDALTTAEETLANYTVTAPFSGTVASVGVKKYDQASSGTAVATVVTDQMTVNLSVSETDAAQLNVGQKATVTFDALPDVTLAGTVSSVNFIGTASSGVVSYGAVITLDTTNSQVLPGMSATADIITGTATGLTVPSSAVKTAAAGSYVLVFNPPLSSGTSTPGATVTTTRAPERVYVTTGLASDSGVIVDGLPAGTEVVAKSSTGTAAAAATASGSSIRGGARAGGVMLGG